MTTELDRVRERYDNRLDSYGDRQYWRDNHAGQDMGALWGRIRDLEATVDRLEREAAEHMRFCGDIEPMTSCQCNVVSHPPCSWCTSADNPLNAEDVPA